MRRLCFVLAWVVVLVLLALPVAASPAGGPASPGSSIVAKVLDAFADLWRVEAPEDAASPAPGGQVKDGDDDSDGRVDAPPLDGLGCAIDPIG